MSKLVLIVDDAKDWRDMLAGLIQDVFPKLEVHVADSLDSAIEYVKSHTFIIAIVDIRLDERDEQNTDGLRFMEHLHSVQPNAKIFIVTGYANIETVRQSMHPNKSGHRLSIDYFEKSQNYRVFIQRLGQVLGEAREL